MGTLDKADVFSGDISPVYSCLNGLQKGRSNTIFTNKEVGPVSGLSCVTDVRQKMNNAKHNIPVAIKKTTMVGQVFRPTCLTFVHGKGKGSIFPNSRHERI